MGGDHVLALYVIRLLKFVSNPHRQIQNNQDNKSRIQSEIKVCLEQNEYEMIVKDTEALSREELKAVIDYWEDEAENSIHEQIQSIAVAELNKRNTARNSQIKLLNRSLMASSRIGRWRSAAKAFLTRFVEIKN